MECLDVCTHTSLECSTGQTTQEVTSLTFQFNIQLVMVTRRSCLHFDVSLRDTFDLRLELFKLHQKKKLCPVLTGVAQAIEDIYDATTLFASYLPSVRRAGPFHYLFPMVLRMFGLLECFLCCVLCSQTNAAHPQTPVHHT